MNTLRVKISTFLSRPCPVRTFWKNLFSQNKITLGRWNTDYCVKKIDKKVDWANEDHCGPCGSAPLQTETTPKGQSKSSKSPVSPN